MRLLCARPDCAPAAPIGEPLLTALKFLNDIEPPTDNSVWIVVPTR